MAIGIMDNLNQKRGELLNVLYDCHDAGLDYGIDMNLVRVLLTAPLTHDQPHLELTARTLAFRVSYNRADTVEVLTTDVRLTIRGDRVSNENTSVVQTTGNHPVDYPLMIAAADRIFP